MNTPSVDQLQDFARTHPYVMFGLLMVPVTYSVTHDLGMALFTGGIVAFGPAIARGFQDANNQDNETGDLFEEPVEAQFDE